MPFTLGSIVPWGRSYDEYAAMFRLTEADRKGRILGCGDGPAAFNAGLTRRGGRVVSADPLYRSSAKDIRRRIEETFDAVMEQTRQNAREFTWTAIPSLEELGRLRMAAMEDFLADYPEGLRQGRYVNAELPLLPFPDGSFDLALCSHLLFLYSGHLDRAFHLASLRELCRVAEDLAAQGCAVDIVPVDYEFQRGGNRMMRVRKGSSETYRNRTGLIPSEAG